MFLYNASFAWLVFFLLGVIVIYQDLGAVVEYHIWHKTANLGKFYENFFAHITILLPELFEKFLQDL